MDIMFMKRLTGLDNIMLAKIKSIALNRITLDNDIDLQGLEENQLW